MHAIQFFSMMMVIQMKLMKVIRNTENMIIQEFQLDRESQLIQLSMTKMHMIQFVSMMKVIQMKLMKIRCNVKNNRIRELQLDRES
jgi:hypothetical protein